MLARTQVTPIQVTWGSAGLALAGATAFGFGSYILGAGLAFVSVITDCIDGDLARMTGRTSRSGAFLDSVLDRWTDAALILGLGYSDLNSFGAVAGLALVGSMVTSYTRARAQSLGTDCPDGIGGRDSRLLILILSPLQGHIRGSSRCCDPRRHHVGPPHGCGGSGSFGARSSRRGGLQRTGWGASPGRGTVRRPRWGTRVTDSGESSDVPAEKPSTSSSPGSR